MEAINPDGHNFGLERHTICVVGLGLMGGSLALALQAKVRAVHGVDPNPQTCAFAKQQIGLHCVAQSLQTDALDADIVVLAAPVRANLAMLAEVSSLARPGTLIFDLSSTKREIVAAMDALPPTVSAVAGHPMCGKEQAGIRAADADLFRERPFVLCETARTDVNAMRIATAVVHAVGAQPITMEPTAHDAIVARVSHLPYLLSAALVASATALTADEMRLAASGYRDTSRLAASDPEMMADVLYTNKKPVIDAMSMAKQQLERLTTVLENNDIDALRNYCRAMQQHRNNWAQRNNAAVASEQQDGTQPKTGPANGTAS